MENLATLRIPIILDFLGCKENSVAARVPPCTGGTARIRVLRLGILVVD